MISQSDTDLDGMQNPYAKKFCELKIEYSEKSHFAKQYETWTLKSLIVKSKDDVRQEVLAIQLMKRLQ